MINEAFDPSTAVSHFFNEPIVFGDANARFSSESKSSGGPGLGKYRHTSHKPLVLVRNKFRGQTGKKKSKSMSKLPPPPKPPQPITTIKG